MIGTKRIGFIQIELTINFNKIILINGYLHWVEIASKLIIYQS